MNIITGIDELNNFLKHYGIKGMRWGIRRRRSRSKIVRSKSDDYSSSRTLIKGKKMSELTNEELKKINERLELEIKFAALDPSVKSRGQRAVGKYLNQFGTVVVSKLVNHAANIAVSQVIKDKAGG